MKFSLKRLQAFGLAFLVLVGLAVFQALPTAEAGKRENPYTLNVKGLTSKEVYKVVETHLAGVMRTPYQEEKTEFLDTWRDKEEKPFTSHAQGTAFFSQNFPYWLKTLNNSPRRHHYVFTTDRSGWNGFSTIETKRTKLQAISDVETVKIELYDSKSMGFHREFWLGFVPYAGGVWDLYRDLDRWAYQSTHRKENQVFMKQLQSDLQAKLDEAKALKK
jgi:hypothetical protein